MVQKMKKMLHTGDQGQLENTDVELSETEEAQMWRRMFFKSKTLPGTEQLQTLLELSDRT